MDIVAKAARFRGLAFAAVLVAQGSAVLAFACAGLVLLVGLR